MVTTTAPPATATTTAPPATAPTSTMAPVTTASPPPPPPTPPQPPPWWLWPSPASSPASTSARKRSMKETARQLALLEPNAKIVAPKAHHASSVALLKQASSSKCTCPATLADSELTKACSSTGDPHYKGWEYVKGRTWGKFDFMGMGTFNLATATLPGCGCQVSWQTVLAANTKYRGATSNVAVAMSVGGTSFIVRADLR